jgi:hypothetical protein
MVLVGCYSLRPTGGVLPEPGTEMGFDITDAGRVALGGSMGPEIGQIEGRLVNREGDEYVIAVSSIHYLRGGQQVWHGERVRVKREYVSSLYQRQLSVPRSVAMGAAGLGAIAFIATRSLIGLNSGDRPGGPSPGDTAHTQRSPRR